MRWRWKIGLPLILGVEIAVLTSAALILDAPMETLVYLAVAVGAILIVLLALRPLLVGLIGVWLIGVAGSAWYFASYVPSAVALSLGLVASTLVCAVGWPFSARILRFVLRRRY